MRPVDPPHEVAFLVESIEEIEVQLPALPPIEGGQIPGRVASQPDVILIAGKDTAQIPAAQATAKTVLPLIGGPDIADVARDMGAFAVRVTRAEDIGPAMREAFSAGRPAVVEIVVDSKALTEPYRRDALKMPVRAMERYMA